MLASAFGDRRDMGMDLRSWRCGSVVGRGDAHWGGPCLLAFSYFGRFRAHAQTWQVGHPQGDGSLRAGDFLTPIFASHERIRIQILSGAALFPWSLAKAMMYFQASIPASAWYVLFKNEAVYDPPTAEQDAEPKRCRKEWVELSSTACQSCPVHRAASMEPKRMQSVKSYISISI